MGKIYYTELAKDRGLRTFPLLVQYAQMRGTVTYGELANMLGIHRRPLRFCLGYVRDEICIKRRLPLITALVVRADTGLPGESFLPEGTGHLTPEQYRLHFERHRDKAFNCTQWEPALQDLGLLPVGYTPAQIVEQGRRFARFKSSRRGGPESKRHRTIKELVAENPRFLGLPANSSSILEYLFATGDRCDVVFFVTPRISAVVEVKDRLRSELVKGVFQAVKYRALIQAENHFLPRYGCRAFLVATRIPSDIRNFASGLEVACTELAYQE